MLIIRLREEYKAYKTMCSVMGIPPVKFEIWANKTV